MGSDAILLSVVCPAYNEENVLPLFHGQLCSVLEQLPAEYRVEIIYVDDGSRDRTLEILRGLAAGDPRVRFLSFSRNFGHQVALTAGLEAARGDAVVSLDSDLQHPPALIPILLEHWRAGKEVVVTIRDDSQSPRWMERWLSQGFYRLMGYLSETEIRPAAADFRLMSRAAVDALLRMSDRHPFLRGMVQWLGFPSAEVHYVPARRGAGHSKYTFRRKLRFALDGLFSFSRAPLRLPLALGVGALAVGFAALAWTLLHSFGGRSDGGLSSTFLFGSLYLLGAGILGALAVVGEYVGRIYDQVRARPLYVVKAESRPPQTEARALPDPTGREAEMRVPAA
jgi:glycosyltransferase involved in cell wall biosynthesis